MSSNCIVLLFTLFLKCCVVTAFFQGMLYPRETQTRQVKSLDGMWDFRADISSTGFEEMWYSLPLTQRGEVIPMPVPSSYNDITEERWLRDFVGWVWYEKVFYVPPSWIATSKRVVLRFDSVYYRCKVWLNNREILQHEGGDLPFEVDITKEVRIIDSLHRRNSHRLTVAVNNTLLFSLPRNSQSNRNSTFCDLSNEYIMDVDFAGIHGSVKLYTTPEIHVSDITYATYHYYNKATIKFATEVGANEHIKWNKLIIDYKLLDREGRVAASAGGKNMFSGEMTVFNPTLWWPIGMSDTPGYLYTLKVTVSYKDIHDVYTLPVGIRTVRVEGSRFLINNIPFYFKGFGKTQDSDIRGRGFDYVTLIRDFNLMKWFGANSIRTSKHPPPTELLELTDKHGIVVIDESPLVGPKELFQLRFEYYEISNYSRRAFSSLLKAVTNEIIKDYISDHFVNRHIDLLTELIQRDKNHPSVVMWSVANHRWVWPSENMASHLERMIGFTRETDMQKRPVTYVTSSEDRLSVVEDSALEFCDVISFNRHYGWHRYPGQPNLIAKSLEEDLRGLHNVFSKPVLMAEYGSSAVAGRHKQPSVIYSEEYQVDTMKQYFPVFDRLRKDFLAGEMIWTFTDYNVLESYDPISANTKGLLNRQRQPKASAHALRQRYQALAMEAHPRFTGDELLDILIRFKPHRGNEYPITFKHMHRLPALIREERVNTTIRKRSVDDITSSYEP